MDVMEQKAMQEYISHKLSDHFDDYYDLMRANMLQATMTGEVIDLMENHTITQASARLDQAIHDGEWHRIKDLQKTIQESHSVPPPRKTMMNPFGFFFGAKAETSPVEAEQKQNVTPKKPE